MDSWSRPRYEELENQLINGGLFLFSKNPQFFVLKNYVSTNLTRKPPIDTREVGKMLHPFLKKNNQSLSSLVLFLDIVAEQICDYLATTIFSESSHIFSLIVKELEGAAKLKFGAFSIQNGRLNVGNTSGSTNVSIAIELLIYSCEIELILDNKLSSDDPLRTKMDLEESEKKNFLGKLFSKGDKKGTDRIKDQKKLLGKAPVEPRVEMRKASLNGILRPFDSKQMLAIREKGLFVIQCMRQNPYTIGKYVNKREGSKFEVPDHDLETKVVELLRNNFNEPLDDKVVSFALEETYGCPKKATKLIKTKRKKSTALITEHFPNIPEEKAVEISDRCLYDEVCMLFLASEGTLNAMPVENDPIDAILKDEKIDKERRINVAALELFSDCIDRMNRATLLLYALSFDKIPNRPKSSGWWDDFDNFTFENLVSCVKNLSETTQNDLLNSAEMNKRCAVCDSYFHISQIFDFECRCTFCIECVVRNMEQAAGGTIETALECLSSSCPNMDMVKSMDEERKSQAFRVKYQYLEEIGRTHPQYKQSIDKYMEMFRLYMTRMIPSFTPCAHCTSGQIQGDDSVKRMYCHACGNTTCHDCKYPWFDEHKSISCAKYKVWLSKNHPEALGLPEGAVPGSLITCPNQRCKEQYMLQRGGCIHFRCKRCPTEFCGICSQIFFTKRNPCPSCSLDKRDTLHAHHPRNCAYYLRDEDPEWLVSLLEMNNINWKNEMKDIIAEDGKCTLLISDEESGPERKCGKLVHGNHSLCKKHIKEFLSVLCFDNHVDPVDKYDQTALNCIFRRENIELPSGNVTVELLRETIKENSPIKDDEDE